MNKTTKTRCCICGGLLQRWENGSHTDCAKDAGYPEPEIDWLEWADEAIERAIEANESCGKWRSNEQMAR
jgi:hypothetical protein